MTGFNASEGGARSEHQRRAVCVMGRRRQAAARPAGEGIGNIFRTIVRRTNVLSSEDGRSVMVSNGLFLTARPLFNDYGIRWVVIAIAGLVSAIGLWKLNITIVWESLWSAIEFDILLLLGAATYSIVGAMTPRMRGSSAIVSDLLLSIFQFIVALKAFTPPYLPCCRFWMFVGGQYIDKARCDIVWLRMEC